jgi:hypothetical protein
MRRYLLLGLAALGLVAMASTESKADEDSAFALSRVTKKSGPITMVTTDTATIDTRTNIGGTDGTARIIGTIRIEIMIGTTTGIDASRFF